MTKINGNSEWPTFRGRYLTAKEQRSGLVITPLYRDGAQPFDSARIPKDLVWIDQRARVFLELRFGWQPFETTDNVSILTGAQFNQLKDDAMKLYAIVANQPIDDADKDAVKPGYLNRVVFQIGINQPISPKRIKNSTT